MAQQRDKVFPERDAIVAFIRANPGKVGTREIAREFGLKNADRVELKQILRELADDGTVAKRGRNILEPAALPPTVVADITGRDKDGELLGLISIGDVNAIHASNQQAHLSYLNEYVYGRA